MDDVEEVYLPEELWEITIMNTPLKELLKLRQTSKEWRDRIDSLWCKLLERDYPGREYDKSKCKEQYEYMHRFLVITNDQLKIIYDKIKDLKGYTENAKKSVIGKRLTRNGFIKKDGFWYFDPKKIFNDESLVEDLFLSLIDDDYDHVVGFQELSNDIGSSSLENMVSSIINKFIKDMIDVQHQAISYRNWVILYERAYGNFNNYFKYIMNHYLNDKGRKYNKKDTPEILLEKFYQTMDEH